MPAAEPAEPDTTLVHALRALLARRSGAPVTLIETHISWVLLTTTLALKLKKPVQLPFLDFRTPEQRRHFALQELRLNRRLAPRLYRAVLAVRGSTAAPRFDGAGEPIDWLLCMRRFADDTLLSQRLAEGRLRPEEVDRLAQRIARFHHDAPVAAAHGEFGAAQGIAQAARSTLAQLGESGAVPAGIGAWMGTQIDALQAPWQARLEAGFVREGHGDLHLSNAVVLGDGDVTGFDCIEFDPALRWIDVMNDIAFVTMDLRARGRADLAWRFLDAYLQAGGDFAGLAVLRFYEVYRALVRLLVAQLSLAGGGAAQAGTDYAACAQALVAEGRRAPRLAILFGLSGSGKSTLALGLVQASGAVRVRSDVERKRLFGLAALQRSAASGHALYTAQATHDTYERLAACVREALAAGYPVLVDGAFLRRDERGAFEALAREQGAPFTVFACEAAPEVLRERVAARAAAGRDASEADLAVLERQMRDHDPLTEAERRHTLVVRTDDAVDLTALASRWMRG